MKKKYKLKEWVKVTLFIILMITTVIVSTIVYVNKIEKVNNDTYHITSDSLMDR